MISVAQNDRESQAQRLKIKTLSQRMKNELTLKNTALGKRRCKRFKIHCLWRKKNN